MDDLITLWWRRHHPIFSGCAINKIYVWFTRSWARFIYFSHHRFCRRNGY